MFPGDVNNDSFADIIIGAPGANHGTGAANVLFGKLEGFTNINLKDLNPADGFTVRGAGIGDNLGLSVSAAGMFRM